MQHRRRSVFRIGRLQFNNRVALSSCDLQDSLVNANGEIYERPGEYGLTVCEKLPTWALA